MQISSSYGLDNIENIWDVSGAGKKYSTVQSDIMRSGDTVDISEDAKKLYSEMIHKYDHASGGAPQQETGDGQSGEGAGNAGGAGGGGQSESAGNVENIKKQIQSLKSQISALTSQMNGGADTAVMTKINSLQAQIAALEAQLSEAESA